MQKLSCERQYSLLQNCGAVAGHLQVGEVSGFPASLGGGRPQGDACIHVAWHLCRTPAALSSCLPCRRQLLLCDLVRFGTLGTCQLAS